ncbi:MAG: hypothetical protein V7L00_32905 [Nostoc sp.]|uniref:hypothetical protein n=1 Tax=Nostoc sp. TaxID=1180 RepID=UPI002FF5EFB9
MKSQHFQAATLAGEVSWQYLGEGTALNVIADDLLLNKIIRFQMILEFNPVIIISFNILI